jgi:DNA topoisomerase-3
VAKKKKVAKPKKARKSSGLTTMTYSVSSELAAVVGSGKLTRPQIVKKLWAYIKSHKCQDAKKRRMINPDAKLSAVLGKKPIDMLKIAGALSKHIKK